MIEIQTHDALVEILIQHEKPQNPFNRAMTVRLGELCAELEADDGVRGVLIWGGPDRSFSVGGDFEEVSQLSEEGETREYLREIVECYLAVVAVTKPVVAAIDKHAIGLGLQVALMSDWRIGSERARLNMPELAGGVACPLGSLILEQLLGRAAMLELVVGCQPIDAERARGLHLLQEVVPTESLCEVAFERLERFASYPEAAYRTTKRIHNERFAEALRGVHPAAADAHVASILSGRAQPHFERILGNRAGK